MAKEVSIEKEFPLGAISKVEISGIGGRLRVVSDNAAEKIKVEITGKKRAVNGIEMMVVDDILVIFEEPDEETGDITIGNISGQVAIGSNISQSSFVVNNVSQSIECSGNSHVGNISQSVGCGISCGSASLFVKVTMPGFIPLKVENVSGNVTLGKFYEIEGDFRNSADIEETVRLKVKAQCGAYVRIDNVKLSLEAKSFGGSSIDVEDGDITEADFEANGGGSIEYSGTMRGKMKLKADTGGSIMINRVIGEPEIKKSTGGSVRIVSSVKE